MGVLVLYNFSQYDAQKNPNPTSAPFFQDRYRENAFQKVSLDLCSPGLGMPLSLPLTVLVLVFICVAVSPITAL